MTTILSEGLAQRATVTYEGDDSGEQVIEVGFRPTAVTIVTVKDNGEVYRYEWFEGLGSTIVEDKMTHKSSAHRITNISDTGFSVEAGEDGNSHPNMEGTQYVCSVEGVAGGGSDV